MATIDVKILESLVRPVLLGLGYELVDLEWKHESGRWLLRLYMDTAAPAASPGEPPAGVSHEDCGRASHAVSAELDVADVIHVPYTLEVSSPGLDRPLKREEDFRRFAGRKAKIRIRRPLGGAAREAAEAARRNFSGQLLGVDAGKVRIDVDGQVYEIPIDDVEKANLTVEWGSRGADGGAE